MDDTPAFRSIPWEKLKALRARVVREGTPPEILELDARIAAAVRNADRLYVLFGLVPCQVAVNEIADLQRTKDVAWGRLAMAEEG